MFKDMGVEIVHLAEFHGDGHPQDPGPLRLPEMEAMFAECRRLSDGELLVLPGEEANIDLGQARAGKEAGHWLYLFPRPVYWTMKRAPGQPFVEDHPPFGRVYHVGNGDDMVRLLEREGGLAWTSHARIKGSSWTPDFFRNQPFYQSDLWLGAAWKAMPADLSLDKLGTRGLDLLDDMANWGQKKYLPGEVDVFKIDHTHELYRPHEHQLHSPRARPRPSLRRELAARARQPARRPILRHDRRGLDPGIHRQRAAERVERRREAQRAGRGAIPIELDVSTPIRRVHLRRRRRASFATGSTSPTQARSKSAVMTHKLDLTGRKWVRLEAWDIATDGAFTQPVWLLTSQK